MYPHWNARDNYRYGLKKKKRKRDKSDDPGKPFRTFSTKNLIFPFFVFSDLKWHSLSREEQSKYYELAQTERQKHMKMYPGWSARDNYAKHKKKRRKRDKLKDGGIRPLLSCPQCHVCMLAVVRVCPLVPSLSMCHLQWIFFEIAHWQDKFTYFILSLKFLTQKLLQILQKSLFQQFFHVSF